MTRQQVEHHLNTLGISLRVFADSDRIVYVPSTIAEELRKNEGFKEIKDDTLFNSLRHQNTGTALIAFQY